MWIVCQIGAREHYAIPCAIHRAGLLDLVITDFWIRPDSVIGGLPVARRLKDRFHSDLSDARVVASNLRMLSFEARQRLLKKTGWESMIARNAAFQKQAVTALQARVPDGKSDVTLFSYSYAAKELFRYAKERGWRTVLGQIDPGPEEERIVAMEHRHNPELRSQWKPAPPEYWSSWREELALADRIIVNSEWSLQCLVKEGVPQQRLEVIPLVYDAKAPTYRDAGSEQTDDESPNLRVLFLGQINLRKGVARLLEAMRLLKDESIELTLAGPSDLDPNAWAHLPNVKWVGAIPRSRVGAYYRTADVFILPTLSDGYALTQLEALSHGLPVIASKHCGAAVLEGKNGWILEDLEPETIARRLRAVAANSNRLKGMPLRYQPDFGLDELAKCLLR